MWHGNRKMLQKNTKYYNLEYIYEKRKNCNLIFWYSCWILSLRHIVIETSGNFFTDCKKNFDDPVFNTISGLFYLWSNWVIFLLFAFQSRNCPIKENNCIQRDAKEVNLFQRQHFLVVWRKEERRKLLKSYLLSTLFSRVPHWEDVNKGRVATLFLITAFLK